MCALRDNAAGYLRARYYSVWKNRISTFFHEFDWKKISVFFHEFKRKNINILSWTEKTEYQYSFM